MRARNAALPAKRRRTPAPPPNQAVIGGRLGRTHGVTEQLVCIGQPPAGKARIGMGEQRRRLDRRVRRPTLISRRTGGARSTFIESDDAAMSSASRHHVIGTARPVTGSLGFIGMGSLRAQVAVRPAGVEQHAGCCGRSGGSRIRSARSGPSSPRTSTVAHVAVRTANGGHRGIRQRYLAGRRETRWRVGEPGCGDPV
jgi:hypothetical protein